MRRSLIEPGVGRVCNALVGLAAALVFPSCTTPEPGGEATARTQPAAGAGPAAPALAGALRAAFPQGRVDVTTGGVAHLRGAGLGSGTTPAAAADAFRQAYARVLGAGANDLVPRDPHQGRRPSGWTVGAPSGGAMKGVGLMYDQTTHQPKFWLYRFGQTAGGVPVHRAGLSALVRNDASNAVVWASSSVRPLAAQLAPPAGFAMAAPDADKSLRTIRANTDFAGRRLAAPTSVVEMSTPERVVWAGGDDSAVSPRLAMKYTVKTAPFGEWEVIADAATADVLEVESLTLFDDVTGAVSGNVTQGDVAMECAPEVPTPFPFAEVDGPSPAQTFSDAAGTYSLMNSVAGPIAVTSLMGGQYFDVVNMAGTVETLTSTVTPPATANFLHNTANTDPLVLAQVNGYANANQIRSFLLGYLPTYPVISTQTNFPVNVNLNSSQSSGLCPGNAFYSSSTQTINLCLGSAQYTNTSFASVAHHEYGHHIIQMAGSGQAAYGEGMSDAIAVLQSGQHGLAFGFFLNQCATALRDAQNSCQYSATSCSSCGSEAHACGQLISGIVWDIRQALAVTNPTTYVDLVNKLVLSSILMHTGTAINPQIAVDMLTLDDDDANLDDGTPHYNEICAGFSAHGISCPPTATGLKVSPAGGLSSQGSPGGPFAPADVVYSLTNAGPAANLTYQVAAVGAVPWLSITNGSGTIALNQSVQVTVAVDQAAAAGLSKGGYDGVVQFTNVTSGVGNTTRTAHLQVGVPVPIYTETFEGGLGGFTLAPVGTPNLWHVSSSCAAAQAGHSLPNSLYFGVDSSCTFNTGAAVAGAATSPAVTITDTSVVKLRFNYFVITEKVSSFDKAAVLVSVNNGAFSPVASNTNAGGIALQEGAWGAAEIDLTSKVAGLTNPTIRVQATFDSVDAGANAFMGFLLDDVTVLALSGGAVNSAPSVNAGPDQTVTLPAAANLNGTVSDDGLPNPPGTVTTTWTMVSGPGTATFANPNAKATTATFSAAGSYTLRLTANDGALSTSDDVVVTVNPTVMNQPPVVNAGPDQTVTLPAAASLNGTVTDDGLPNPPGTVTTTWTKVSGPGTVTFANGAAKVTTATFSASGSYTLRLTANDGSLGTSDDLVVTVNPASGGNGPCASLCTNPTNITVNGSFQSGNIGTGAVCYQTTSVVHGGNCGNFVSPRTLKVNGTTEACNNQNWSSIPPARNGGYCIQTTAGNQPWAFITLF